MGRTSWARLALVLVSCGHTARPAGPPSAEARPATPGPHPRPARSAAARAPTPTGQPGGPAAARATAGPPPAMVAVPGGTFMMGSEDGYADERPPHRVEVLPFELDRREVTVGEHAACVAAAGCTAASTASPRCNAGQPGRDDHPLNCVSWEEATTYCAWKGKRLPTEEEWEYAARGPQGRPYPWGRATPDGQLCWRRLEQGTCAVGEFPAGATPLGVLDLAGNVAEWTASPACSYAEPGCGSPSRVYRGGAWFHEDPQLVRSAIRNRYFPDERDTQLGFRCARDAPVPQGT